MRQINKAGRFIVDDNIWPPEQPKSFIPLLLVYYQGHHTADQVKTMAKLMATGDIDMITGAPPPLKRPKLNICELEKSQIKKVLETSQITKRINDILSSFENTESPFLLIEGAPGIGKSFLLREIAFRWSNKELLQKFELVLLLSLHDPSLHCLEYVEDLLQLYFIGDKNATEITRACSEYLSDNGGTSLLLLLDGYDEYPKCLRKDSFIANILKRKILPYCGLVIASRPHASEYLHKQAIFRVDILGFTEMERKQYIEQALSNQPHKIKELTQYLQQQPSIDSICLVPFNMVVLLYLYKQETVLPKNATEMCNHFICQTIYRHLYKSGGKHSITNHDLANLPEPYNEVVKQLSKLSLEALNDNRLTFTLDEIKSAIPEIVDIPGAINGFGLLQAVRHSNSYETTTTFHFIHLTIQEFLAAHYITHLPPNQELQILSEKFWSDTHFNMFSIYLELTKGQHCSFKTFLSDGNNTSLISHKFLKDQLQCLHLYYPFKNANDNAYSCTIEHAKVFDAREIILRNSSYRLVTKDLECISLFLISSFHKKWLKLDLWHCHIQDHGLRILHHGLHHTSCPTIENLTLMNNSLTAQSSSSISEISLKCKVKRLLISYNNSIGEDCQLYSILTDPLTMLELLGMDNINLSSNAAVSLFTAMQHNNKLKVLYITNNDIDINDDVCNAITTAIKKNHCLVELHMWGNQITDEAIKAILQVLKNNLTMELLWLPNCSHEMQQYVSTQEEVINKGRKKQTCEIKLKIEAVVKQSRLRIQ